MFFPIRFFAQIAKINVTLIKLNICFAVQKEELIIKILDNFGDHTANK
jgi:hypothetical protein